MEIENIIIKANNFIKSLLCNIKNYGGGVGSYCIIIKTFVPYLYLKSIIYL